MPCTKKNINVRCEKGEEGSPWNKKHIVLTELSATITTSNGKNTIILSNMQIMTSGYGNPINIEVTLCLLQFLSYINFEIGPFGYCFDASQVID